jgi:hypothetical protein
MRFNLHMLDFPQFERTFSTLGGKSKHVPPETITSLTLRLLRVLAHYPVEFSCWRTHRRVPFPFPGAVTANMGQLSVRTFSARRVPWTNREQRNLSPLPGSAHPYQHVYFSKQGTDCFLIGSFLSSDESMKDSTSDREGYLLITSSICAFSMDEMGMYHGQVFNHVMR